MKKHIILAGTTLAAVALCCAICGGKSVADTVPAPATESAVSASCAPQTQSSEPSSNIIITEPVTEPETVPVTGSAASPEPEYPQTTPTAVPVSTPAEEPAAEQPAEEPPAQDGMLYVPGFGYLKSEGPGEWSVSEGMYENGNKVGIMG